MASCRQQRILNAFLEQVIKPSQGHTGMVGKMLVRHSAPVLHNQFLTGPHKHSAISKKREMAMKGLLALVRDTAGNLGEKAAVNCSGVDFCVSCTHTTLEFWRVGFKRKGREAQSLRP